MANLQQQARALGDPTRYGIFEHLRRSADTVDVAELTEQFGLNHNAIRQHLAKLVDAGLAIETQAPPDGPGRPRLEYDVSPSIDSRWGAGGPYERLSVLLTEIVSSGESPIEVGRRSLPTHPPSASTTAAAVNSMATAMARQGFEPEIRRSRKSIDIVLRHCPFETAALADPDVVCDLHLGMAEGLASCTGRVSVEALVRKDPRRAQCRLKLSEV